jgi:hypothetical protein
LHQFLQSRNEVVLRVTPVIGLSQGAQVENPGCHLRHRVAAMFLKMSEWGNTPWRPWDILNYSQIAK